MAWICTKCETHNTHGGSGCEVCGQVHKGASSLVKESHSFPKRPFSLTPFWRVGGVLLLIGIASRLLNRPSATGSSAIRSRVGKGLFSIRSNKPNATLFYRLIGTHKWRYADCSPQIKIALPPGRYEVKIEGVGGHMLLSPREAEVSKDRTTSITAPG